jgi:hypothetical protein
MKTSNNIYLPFIESRLSWSGTREWSNGKKIPNIYKIYINDKKSITIDERFNIFNILKINSKIFKNKILIIKQLYNKLKSSNPSYGTNDTNLEIEWDPTDSIFIEDFFDFLKNTNREKNINKIINE